jgi:SAM-dependent methyltransferase
LRKSILPEAECIALDLSFTPALAERAKAERITLVQGNIELDFHALRDGAHDLIIMSQILEHLRDPMAALESLRAKLSHEGLLLLETPNLGGLDYLLFRKRYWGGYHLPRHFHLFTKNALGLNSRTRGSSMFESLNFSNLPAVGAFTALDLACIALGLPTSNQFALLARDWKRHF